jgi:hypothetical protein
LTDPTYQSWLQDDPHLFWLCGGPGKGKTMMSIFLTQALERQNGDDIIYYFCNSEDDRNSTSSAILRALIWQILAKRPGLVSLVLPYFTIPERSQAVLSTPGTLLGILVQLAQDAMMAPMYCLIDGLDECEHDSIRWISSRLFEFYGGTQTINLRICIVSRDVPELRHARRILLDPDNNDKVDTDVNNFTSIKMVDLTRRHNLSHDLRLQIQTRLLQKSEGTFLWIGYAMNELLTKATVMQVLEALEELPVALPALYSRMIRTIAADKLQICTSILSWVALAERSLTVAELAEAVEWHVPSQLTPEQAAQDYISLCKSLVSIQAGKVVLVHQSVKDYLLRTQTDDDPVVESVRIKRAESHLAMADRCLKALGRGSEFVFYARLYWPEHAKQCEELARPWIVANKYFFKARSKARNTWWQIHVQVSKRLRNRLKLVQVGLYEPPQLHMACLLGFSQWVEDILTSKRRFLKPWKRPLHHGGEDILTPLHFAVCGFHVEAAECLLEKGADVDRDFGSWWSMSAFDHAMRQFPESCAILECMLAHGADVNRLVRKAIYQSDVDLLDFAIKHNASLNSPMEDGKRDGNSTTSLHLALESGYRNASMIKKLLEAGADPLIEDGNSKTALQLVRAGILLEEADGRRPFHADSLRVITDMFKELGYFDE